MRRRFGGELEMVKKNCEGLGEKKAVLLPDLAGRGMLNLVGGTEYACSMTVGDFSLSMHEITTPKSAYAADAKGAIVVGEAAGLDGHAIVGVEVIAAVKVMGEIEVGWEGLSRIKVVEKLVSGFGAMGLNRNNAAIETVDAKMVKELLDLGAGEVHIGYVVELEIGKGAAELLELLE